MLCQAMLLFLVALLQMPYVLQRSLSGDRKKKKSHLQPNFNVVGRVCKHDNSPGKTVSLGEKHLWFSLRLLLFYLLCYLSSMAAGQVTEKFLSQLAGKTDGVAKQPKNGDKKISDIYLCKILWPDISKISDIRVLFQLPGI